MESSSKFGGFSESFTAFFTKKNRSTLNGPPHLVAPRHSQGQFEFESHLPKGLSYELEVSPDLKNWNSFSKGKSDGSPLRFADRVTGATRFFRLRTENNLLSDNVLGWVQTNYPPGYSMVGNPLKSPDPRLESLMPQVPEGTSFDKFDTTLFRLTKNSFTQGRWNNPGETLSPGEGALLSNPTDTFRQLVFVGEVLRGDLSLPIPAGFSIRCSLVPLPGVLDADLRFPIAEGDVVHLFERDRQEYGIFKFADGKWSPSPPVIAAGEAFWIGKTHPGNWDQTDLLAER